MSRIGKLPVVVPAGVEVKLAEGNLLTVKGPKGTLERNAIQVKFFWGETIGEIYIADIHDFAITHEVYLNARSRFPVRHLDCHSIR